MPVLELLMAVGAAAVIALVVVGLVTGRLDRHAEGCCTADPDKDPRMRAALRDLADTPPPGPER